MFEWLNHIIQWLHTHPEWAGAFAFLFAFLESLAIVGSFIPGTATLTLLGGLIGAGIIPATSIFVLAILGAIAGDAISYWLGYHYHQQIRQMWPFNRYPRLFTKGEDMFVKHGGKSVFFSRFLGPVRAFVPLIAGMMDMKPSRFYFANITSAICWAPFHLVPGILLGAGLVKFSRERAGHIILVCSIAIVIGLIACWLSKRLFHFLYAKLDHAIQYRWENTHIKSLKYLLADPQRPHHHRQ
ncbi:MAG: DedA family protein, partial [Gammaproteobacteria bacterium]|nr:DedA family protein [Gammaproteobacteria bacterium]